MELSKFLEKLGELQNEIDLYNLYKMDAQFSSLYVPRDKSNRDDKYEVEYFMKCLDKRDELMSKADEAKNIIQNMAREIILDLHDSGLKSIRDLDNLATLDKLARGWM